MNAFTRTMYILIFIAVAIFYPPHSQSVRSTNQVRCEIIERALSDYNQIKVGDRRKDVEKRFRRGGGLQFPSTTHYTYVDSEYLHVDVEFQEEQSTKPPFSPDNVIGKKSKLYIDYEPRD